MVCVDGMGREKHSIWYGTFAVWYHGTMSWMYYMAKFAWWYGMFQYIRSVRVEYVVRISSVTSLYIGHWKVFENISLADRQTDRFAFTKTETQFYKLRIRGKVAYITYASGINRHQLAMIAYYILFPNARHVL